ncbi:CUB and sushi domain-containing protein 3 CUB and sushi multiple domains protein 3 [Channa argus]|uniref:CUB and sushi domain-containing protein 3 CUB and sushi multiple domains protein 3 n=1 Tax=Channa argus TaxID=215402 RepID=A0A6G1PN73_CHAAH|nr:CUB and sushi domain-containing protein 3 CUB and sushi multiple domains protein 3 [Channa argus]
MKGIYREGYYDGSIELLDVFNRRCIKCGRRDFVQTKTMRTRTGIVFWNLIFSLMFTCVKEMFREPFREPRKLVVWNQFVYWCLSDLPVQAGGASQPGTGGMRGGGLGLHLEKSGGNSDTDQREEEEP